MPEGAYHRLEARFRRLGALADAEAMLHWDLATMMPRGGGEARAEQLATLKALRHGLLTDPAVGEWLAAAEAMSGLDPWQAGNLREMRRLHRRATALDERQVDALSRATTACEAAWRDARADADFARVLPAFKVLLGLVRETAAAKAEGLGLAPYDALLDEYEPDARIAEIGILFDHLAEALPPLLARLPPPPPAVPPGGPFPIEAQRRLAVRLMAALGFDFDHGRLDVSLHPFCGGTPDDVRITTRYDEADFRPALMGVLHETGHALYQRGLPAAWRGQPVGDARGMVLHESQSLLIEMQVCRSRPFLAYARPLIAEAFGGAWEPEALYRHYTRVEPGFIRVDADEVTYPLHILLRTRLEQDLLAGTLDPADLPEAWGDGMMRHFGLKPPDDRQGCLQDIHWYDGAFGYFPTYTLGALAAAQLYAAAREADPAIETGIARGDFAPLTGWLARHVHGKGALHPTRRILIEATGGPLATDAFLAHLKRRYLDA